MADVSDVEGVELVDAEGSRRRGAKDGTRTDVEVVTLQAQRVARLEQALFNIERGMTGVEASVGALPRALRTRIDRGRRPTAGEAPPTPGRSF